MLKWIMMIYDHDFEKNPNSENRVLDGVFLRY